MAQNIGYATISIIPSAKGFGKALSGQVDAETSAIGSRAGQNLYQGITSGVLKAAGVAIGTVASIGTAVAGLALTGGFNRALAIDQATAKLTGLGHSTDAVKAIMNNALASVKGTAFGLGEASGVAASMVASGIQPGKQLEGVLRTVADTASIAGISMQDMGAIFGSVAARGKLQGDDLLQLTSRGVPVLQFLSKQLGVTSADVSDMVSRGEIDFATFNAAMQANLGGAAIAFGQTFTGSLQNAHAALGRLGALFIQPALPVLTQAIVTITGAFDSFGASLTPLIERWSAFLASDSNSLVGSFALLLPLFGALGGMLAPLTAGIPILGPALAGLTGPIGLVAGALVALVAIKPEQMMAGVATMVPALQGMITGVASAIATVLPQMATQIAANLPILLNAFSSVLMTLATAIPTILPGLVAAVVTLIPAIATALIGAAFMLIDAGVQLLTGIVQAIPVFLPGLITAVVGILPYFVTTLLGMVGEILNAAVSLFTAIVDALPQIIPPLITAIVGLLPTIVTSVISMIPRLIEGAIQLFTAIITAIPKIIPQLIGAIIDLLPTIISSVLSMIPALIQGAVQLFIGIVLAIPQIIPQLWNALIALGPKMASALGEIIPTILESGKNIISGLVDGLWSAAGAVGSALLKIAQNAVGGFLNFLGIHSPSRLFKGFGVNIGEGLALGIGSMEGEVSKATLGLANAADDALTGPSALSLTADADIAGTLARSDGGLIGAVRDSLGAGGNSASLEYHQHGGQGLTAEQELRKAARKLKTLSYAR